MNSFDIFDTVIARRCIEPHNVFCEVAERIQQPQFVELRVEAERTLLGAAHTIDDIYIAFASLLGQSPDSVQWIKNIEIEIEHKNTILIADISKKITSGDLLVSDMYLNASQIRSLLNTAGFHKETPIYQSNSGKATGAFWQSITADGVQIRRHQGDNPHADGAQPQAFGVKSALTNTHVPNAFESYLRRCGAELLARSCRELRLRVAANGFFETELRTLQCGVNIPILLMASAMVRQLCLAKGIKQVLFSSRDCLLWLRLSRQLRILEDSGITSEYFYTSRISKTTASQDYLEYLQNIGIENSLVLDICGTGWSCRKLQTHYKKPLSFFFINLLGKEFSDKAYPASIEPAVEPEIRGVFKNISVDPSLFEALNYADHASVLDVKKTSVGLYLPIYRQDETSPEAEAATRYSHHLFDTYLQILKHYDVNALINELCSAQVSIPEMMRTLYGNMNQHEAFFHVFKQAHHNENIEIAATLWSKGQ